MVLIGWVAARLPAESGLSGDGSPGAWAAGWGLPAATEAYRRRLRPPFRFERGRSLIETYGGR